MQGVLAHQHCEICGKVVAMDVRFCSTACDEAHDVAQRFKKKQMIKLIAIIAGVLILLQLVRLGII